MRLDRAADRQPGLLPREGGGDRRRRGAPACGAEDAARRAAAQIRARVAAGRVGGRGRARRSSPRCARAATGACEELRGALRRGARARGARSPTMSCDAALDALDADACAPAWRSRSPTCARWPRPGWTRTGRHAAARGRRSRCARSRCGARRSTRPAAATRIRRSVVMGAVTARAAGVDEVYVVAAPHPVMLAAAELCGVDGVFAITGAQAVAALAYGTESMPQVDVIVGPGQPLGAGGQAAGVGRRRDRRLRRPVRPDRDRVRGRGRRGAGARPAGAGRARRGLADRRGQRRPGDPRRARTRPSKVLADDLEAALAFAEALAPEHLQLAGAAAEALAPRIRSAGCLFVGNAAGTAFGDYVAGSNHTLPTEGAARFASGLNVRHFRRRMAEVRLNDAAPALARRRPSRADRRTRRRLPRPRRLDERAASDCAAPSESRTARRSTRKTGETDVSLTLGLSGTGAGTRDTGVGFFDHMLDLLARHGRLDLEVSVTGDLQTGVAPHGRGHRDRARAGARPGARRPPRDRPLRARGGADGRGARGLRARHLRPPVRADHGLRAAARRATSTASSTRSPRSSSAPWPAPRG